MDYRKYKKQEIIKLDNRTWPNKQIEKAPIWCSVDLRDGNQALAKPMTIEEKLEMFKRLIEIGFKEIEVGFPAASDTEFEFVRELIEKKLIPDDVKIQVLTQAREHIIEKTFKSLEGVKSAIVHFYNSTSTLQRDVVFNKSKDEVKEIAVNAAILCKDLAEKYGEERFIFEYSPESFTGTEMDYAIEVVDAVSEIIKPTKNKKLIINLPATVEMTMPNVYADQIEYVSQKIKNRENILISIHAHNDRGTAVAASEMALLAGADRIEGTLFGNGERTGNMDIITMAMNLYSSGINPELDFSDMDSIITMYENITNLKVGVRQPYAGMYVYTAFSGSHQDAINKGINKIREKKLTYWEVPYIPIDPVDIGRNYDDLIRINSQSGKGGVAYILKENFGMDLPKDMQVEFSREITKVSVEKNKDLSPFEILNIFKENYVNIYNPIKLISFEEITDGSEAKINAKILIDEVEKNISSSGNGLLHSFVLALNKETSLSFDIENYNEHGLEIGTMSQAITYLKIRSKEKTYYGVGISSSVTKSSLRAVVSALNKLILDNTKV